MEEAFSRSSWALTLTYRGDVPEAAILTYSDFQAFIRRLRDAGFQVRYLCAGEYGELRGRAHWHAALFFSGDKIPDLKPGDLQQWEFWPHGHVCVQETSAKGFAYMCKYLVTKKKSANKQAEQKRLMMSKKPVLGYQYLMSWAAQHALDGVEPTTYEYTFRDVRYSNGEPMRFFLQGKSRELFMAEYLRLTGKDWQSYRSQLVKDWLDLDEKRNLDPSVDVERFVSEIDASRPAYVHIVPEPDESESVLWFRFVRFEGEPVLITSPAPDLVDIDFKGQLWRVNVLLDQTHPIIPLRVLNLARTLEQGLRPQGGSVACTLLSTLS